MTSQSTPQSSYILCGIPLAASCTHAVVMSCIASHLRSGHGTARVVTVNPEILLRAHRNSHYRNVVASAQIRTVDGIGAVFALWWRYGVRAVRVTGVDLVAAVCAYAQDNDMQVHCAVRADGLSDTTHIINTLRTQFPRLRVSAAAYTIDGNVISPTPAASAADIVLCGFGAPWQEYFAMEYAQSVRHRTSVVIGVGGTFDFMTGRVRRAPHVMRSVGLEWLWRLARQPQRITRMIRATVIFPIIILRVVMQRML